jgi:hypothetical protein
MPANITNYAGLVDIVRLDVPGADDGAIRVAVREAGRSFCIKTEAWLETLTLDAVADQTEYVLEYSAGTLISRIVSLEVNGEAVDADDYSYEANGTLELNTAPEVDDGDEIEAKVVVIPRVNKDEISEDIISRWGDFIAAGAVARLARSPKKPYSSAELYAVSMAMFNDGLTRAKQERVRARKLPVPGWSG